MTTFVRELKRRNVFRVGAAYLVTAWLLIQVAETLFPLFGFDETPARFVVIVLAIGFIPVVVVAWIYELTPDGLRKDRNVDRSEARNHNKNRALDFAILGMLVLALGYFAFDKFVLDPRRDAAATADAIAGIAEVRELVDEKNFARAYARAYELDRSLPVGPLRDELWEIASRTVSIESDPPGAAVWVRPYDSSEDDWKYLGRTPERDVRVAQGMGRVRMVLEGYRPLNRATFYGRPMRLDPIETTPEEMVRVVGQKFNVGLIGLGQYSIELPDFLIERLETTNREYQQFVNEGGYEDSGYWEHKFIKDGRELSFDEAMTLFKDKTGRFGPSTWEAGVYPEGQADHPVGGISWFEAAAFARFRGKQLPTLFHWYLASLIPIEYILPHSNFGNMGTMPVGTSGGISGSGALDMAGNIREWVWNESEAGRYLLGGGWRDPEYTFADGNAQSPFDRDELNGVRLMLVLQDSNLELSRKRADKQLRDYETERPVPDDIFDLYRRLYDYDPMPLNAEVVAREKSEYWTREKIELDAAYGNERMAAYLYIPHEAEPPFSPVVYFPGTNAIYRDKIGPFSWPFLMRSGHAVLVPVYKGTYGRSSGLKTDVQDKSSMYREHVIAWSKDLGRSVDYLETRPDIVMDKLVFFGASWGAAMGPVMIAMESRFKAALLVAGGLNPDPTNPEVDPFNFLPRVRVPTLMINMPTDYLFPLERSQKPFFGRLGAEVKEHVVVKEGRGHAPPMSVVVRESLNWFDQHL